MSCYSQEPQKCSWQFGYKNMPSRSLLYLLASFMWIQETLSVYSKFLLGGEGTPTAKDDICLPNIPTYIYTVQKTHRHTRATFDWWGYLNPVPNVLLVDTTNWWLRAGHSEEKRDRTFPVSWIWWAHQLWNTKISVEREIDTCFQHCQSPPRNPQQHPNYK